MLNIVFDLRNSYHHQTFYTSKSLLSESPMHYIFITLFGESKPSERNRRCEGEYSALIIILCEFSNIPYINISIYFCYITSESAQKSDCPVFTVIIHTAGRQVFHSNHFKIHIWKLYDNIHALAHTLTQTFYGQLYSIYYKWKHFEWQYSIEVYWNRCV